MNFQLLHFLLNSPLRLRFATISFFKSSGYGHLLQIHINCHGKVFASFSPSDEGLKSIQLHLWIFLRMTSFPDVFLSSAIPDESPRYQDMKKISLVSFPVHLNEKVMGTFLKFTFRPDF